jgi:LmbE family N-acetylglucosaminyl deacetylase
MKVLAVVAHPDDELIGMGGTLLKHKATGDEIFIHILTDGHSSRLEQKTSNKYLEETVKRRIDSANNVAEQIGVSDLLIDRFDDQMLDSYPLIEVIRAVEKFGNKIFPNVVYTHFGGDLNIDHRITNSAVLTAFRPGSGVFPEQIFCAETLSSTEWGVTSFHPNCFVDITEFIDKKLTLLTNYKSEFKNYPHPLSLENINNTGKKWGGYINVQFAEAFQLIRKIWR